MAQQQQPNRPIDVTPRPATPLSVSPEQLELWLGLEADGKLNTAQQSVMSLLRESGVVPPRPTEAMRAHRPGPMSIPPPPDPRGSGLLTGARSVYRAAGPLIEGFTDPEAIGGIAGGIAAGARRFPAGMAAAGAGSAVGAVARETTEALRSGHQPTARDMSRILVEDALPAAAAGAIGEGIGRGVGAVIGGIRRMRPSAAGRQAADFYAREGNRQLGRPEQIPLHQLVENPLVDVAGNIATYGPGGRSIMEAGHQTRSGLLQHSLVREAEGVSPSGQLSARVSGGRTGIDPAIPGRAVQRSIRSQLNQVDQVSGFGAFVNQWGDTPIQHQLSPGVFTGDPDKRTVRMLLDDRAQALARGREAAASGDRLAFRAAASQAEAADNLIESSLPPHALQQFRTASAVYRSEMGRLANPVAYKVTLESKADEILKNVLHNKLPTFAPLETGMSLSNEELVRTLQRALTPTARQQLQADLIYEMTNAALDSKSGLMNPQLMRDLLGGLSEPVRTAIFGQSDTAIQEALEVLLNELPRSEVGRLFVAIRTPAAAMAVGSGVAATAGLAGTGRDASVSSGLITAASILMMPRTFAWAMTSPLVRRLFVNMAQAPTGQQQRNIATHIMRLASQAGIHEIMESTGDSQQQPGVIPPPPTAPTGQAQ